MCKERAGLCCSRSPSMTLPQLAVDSPVRFQRVRMAELRNFQVTTSNVVPGIVFSPTAGIKELHFVPVAGRHCASLRKHNSAVRTNAKPSLCSTSVHQVVEAVS